MSGTEGKSTSNIRLGLDYVSAELNRADSTQVPPTAEYHPPEEAELGQLFFVGDEFKVVGSTAKPRTFKVQRRKGTAPPRTTENVPAATLEQLKEVAHNIDHFIIDPMIDTEWRAVQVGIVFYAVLVVAVLATAIVANQPYATVGSLAIGSGGAVAALSPFSSSITTYYRTKRTLNNIKDTWTLETSSNFSQARRVLEQMQAFLDSATTMPAPYGSAPPAPTGGH